MIQLANWYFLLLIPVIVYLFFAKKKISTLKFSSVKLLEKGGMKKTFKHLIGKYLIFFALVILVVALARPQIPEDVSPLMRQGIDIVTIFDVSGSMKSVDFEPNRFEVAKKTIGDFVAERTFDRTALIIFAGTAFTRIPLTLDHNVFQESLTQVTTQSVGQDGTAIGMAISVGLNRLKKSETRSKVMILVTDGDNNAGEISPETASGLAKEMGVKIYTIGVGTDQTILPVQIFGQTRYQQMAGGLNEHLLTVIADTTGGKYFRAKDPKSMAEIFANINKLEKTEFKQDNFRQYNELAFMLIKIALVLLAAGIFLDRYYFVQIP